MIRLEDTSGSAVSAAISGERHRMGSPTVGMVLTLLILADEETQSDATNAAATSAREHPMRILTMIPRPGRGPHRLDAEISVGGDDGPGEVVVMRLRGALADHAGSVAIPLLLPDTPVVAWWPGEAPDEPAHDAIGRHAQQRITDAAAAADPLAALAVRQRGYVPGDVDLAWARLTPWRSVLAAALDQAYDPIGSVTVEVERGNPSGPLLVTWLRACLQVPARMVLNEGPGVTAVRLATSSGDIAVTRPDGSLAQLSRPGVPDSTIALPRRDLTPLLTEELRRLDPDDMYHATLHELDPRLLDPTPDVVELPAPGAEPAAGGRGRRSTGRGSKGTGSRRPTTASAG